MADMINPSEQEGVGSCETLQSCAVDIIG